MVQSQIVASLDITIHQIARLYIAGANQSTELFLLSGRLRGTRILEY